MESCLLLQLSKGAYCSGERISGWIDLKIVSDIEKCVLEIQFKGLENVLWVEPKRGSEMTGSVYDSTHYLNQKLITNSKYKVRSWELLRKGEYRVPFIFTTPPDLPDSFAFTGLSTNLEILYKIHARVTAEILKLVDKRVLNIQNAAELRKNEDFSISKLQSLFCVSRGRVRIGCNWVYGKDDDKIECFLRIDNRESRVNIKSVSINIECRIQAVSSGGYTKNIAFDCIKKKINKNIPKGQQVETSQGFVVNLDLLGCENLKTFPFIRSTKGKSIECQFFSSILLESDTFCCSTVPSLQSLLYFKPTNQEEIRHREKPFIEHTYEPSLISYNFENEIGSKGISYLIKEENIMETTQI